VLTVLNYHTTQRDASFSNFIAGAIYLQQKHYKFKESSIISVII